MFSNLLITTIFLLFQISQNEEIISRPEKEAKLATCFKTNSMTVNSQKLQELITGQKSQVSNPQQPTEEKSNFTDIVTRFYSIRIKNSS